MKANFDAMENMNNLSTSESGPNKEALKYSKMRGKIRHEMKKVFKIPEQAFADLDFEGKGYLIEKDFFHTILNYKLPYTQEQIKEFLDYEKLFVRSPKGQMNFEGFKKAFFPKRFAGSNDDAHEEEFKLEKNLDENSKSEILVQRLLKLEEFIKEKFSSNFVSIRKAFLSLDTDYDGCITAEDIARQFGKVALKLDFRDLRTLMKNRDSKREGRINFQDFCKWMGGAIEPTETFYFRHDSLRNPQYEENLHKQSKKIPSRKIVSDTIMNSNLMKRFFMKIQTQWKTLKKAFSDLNSSKNGWIQRDDLNRYLTNWGLDLTENQFEDLYSFLDHDKDGRITYEDFKKSVGSVISPVEFLYFRQDIAPQRLVTCQHENCWDETKGTGKYCSLHKKIIKDKSLMLLDKFQKTVKPKVWTQFLKDLLNSCIEKTVIPKDKLIFILDRYGFILNDKEKDNLLESMNLRDEGNNIDIDIKPILIDLKQSKDINTAYNRIDLEKREDDIEQANITQKLLPISEENFVKELKENKSLLHSLFREIKKLDLDSNGYLTNDELNLVFSQVFPHLNGRSMHKIFKPYKSIQNKSLINYKKLISFLQARMNQVEDIETKESLKHDTEKLGPKELNEPHQLELDDQDLENKSNRCFSPNTKRMENMKSNFIKAIASEIGEDDMTHEDFGIPRIIDKPGELRNKTKLDALISPRKSRNNHLPQLTSTNFAKSLKKLPAATALSPSRKSMTKSNDFSTFSTPFQSKMNDILKHKLSYEWKNIYRSLNTIDLNSSGLVTRKEFQSCVHKHGAFLTRNEYDRIQKRFSQNGDINYYRLSVELGLHKPSYNYMKPHSKSIKSVSKLKSVRSGPNDTNSQLGEIIKAVKSERMGKRESTNDAIKYSLSQNKHYILKMCGTIDKNRGKISKRDFLRILRTFGIFPSQQSMNAILDPTSGEDQVFYKDFITTYE
ncbi:unnamed protein product [Moneuplotes crassus]|uniref:EF-hand domain-containing protein n=1 Tax=Euplotes crassus TaxID=5936 RepID=A0AAD1XYG0_EUPCR|nr:unnamed protein product [Moneuplotes crassus]